MSTVQPPSSAAAADQRSWISQHKILTTSGVLFVAALVAFFIFGWPLVKWRYHSLFVQSLAEIRVSQPAIERLGEPIEVPMLPLPSGRVFSQGNNGDARFDFTVVGSKQQANAISILRMIDGKWGFTQLKLLFPDKSELDLSSTIQNRGDDDTPKFDPNSKSPEVKPPDLPVNIELPNLPESPTK